MVVSLAEMKIGEEGIVSGIQGGLGAAERIKNIGIRMGKRIKKTGGRPGQGPQTVLIDKFNVAIGFGMAAKVMVEVEGQ